MYRVFFNMVGRSSKSQDEGANGSVLLYMTWTEHQKRRFKLSELLVNNDIFVSTMDNFFSQVFLLLHVIDR